MDTLNVNTIEPEGGTTTINVGLSGKNVIITDNLKANTLKDAGGNTIFTSNGSGVLSSVNSGFGSAQVLLSTQTASDSANVAFTSGIDSTYKEYIFEWINVNPATDNVQFQFEGSTGSFGVTKTTTFFIAYHREDDSNSGLEYNATYDEAQSTDPQTLVIGLGNASDECGCGELHLFNPSSTTYVKNFYATSQAMDHGGLGMETFIGGYFNTTSAITGFRFSMTSGNVSSGTFKMYGIK